MEGARPGTARLRGMIAIHGASREGEDLLVEAKPNYKQYALPAPVLPAGYAGSDDDKGPFGHLPPAGRSMTPISTPSAPSRPMSAKSRP